jgi:hypothetical protein
MADPSIYDQLAKESFSDLTITQLNAGTSVTAVDQATINYWKGPLTLARVLEASRTYAGGTLPIPETGAIETVTITGGGDNTIRPTGTELWNIKAIFGIATGGAATVMMSYTDGVNAVPIKVGAAVATSGTAFDLNEISSVPFTLSNALYLQITETGGANAVQFFVAYYKVSL